jgi:hypothetical protein
MAGPHFADGGDGLQIWRAAASILNKRLRTADKRWSSTLGVGREANNTSPVKSSLLRNGTQILGLGLILWNDLGSGKWLCDLEHGIGVSIGQVY